MHAFAENQRDPHMTVHRKCSDCEERRTCQICGIAQTEECFTKFEWVKTPWLKSERGRCKRCMQWNRESKKCSRCNEFLSRDGYPSDFQWRASDSDRTCSTCSKRFRGQWPCVQCKERKPKSEFSMWLANKSKQAQDGKQRCNACKQQQNAEQRQMASASAGAVVKRKRES